MKRLGLTLAAALVFSVSMFAEGVQDNNAQKWNGSINKSKLFCANKTKSSRMEPFLLGCCFVKSH